MPLMSRLRRSRDRIAIACFLAVALLAIGVAAAWAYCLRPRTAISRLEAIDPSSMSGTLNEKYSMTWEQAAEIVRQVETSQELKKLFYECEGRLNSHFWRWRLGSWPNSFFDAQSAIFQKLGDSGRDGCRESARILVQLSQDESLRIDTELAESYFEALVTCGETCLPYLRQIEVDDSLRDGSGSQEFVREVTEYIEQGCLTD